LRYKSIPPITRRAALAALRGDPGRLVHAVLAVALHEGDVRWAERYCRRVAGHDDPDVRGNALLSLGHLARRSGTLDQGTVKPLLEAGLAHPDRRVRQRAEIAADDVEFFLGWSLRPRRL